jgi:hypothetical protein
VALVVPAGAESLGACLHYVEAIPESVQSRFHAVAPWYRPVGPGAGTDRDVGAGGSAGANPIQGSYWANHCEHCDALQDEYELHCEPGGTFMPASAAEAAQRLAFWDVAESFYAVAGGCSHDPPF